MGPSVDPRRPIRRAALAAAWLLGTCGAAQAAVSVAPASVTVTRGRTSGPITVTLVFPAPAPAGTGIVAVSLPAALAGRASTVPSPVTYTWADPGTPSATATFRIAVSGAAPAGTYSIAIIDVTRGSGSATLTLVITAPPAPPPTADFAFRLQPSAVVLEPGGPSARVSVLTERRTLTGGTIAYSVSGLPPGVTVGPAAVASAPAFAPVELTLSAAPGTVPGQYAATVRGVHPPGSLTRTQPLAITVRPPPPQVDAIDPAVLGAGTPNHPLRVRGRHFQPGAALEAPAYLRFTAVRVLGPGRIEATVSVRADAPARSARVGVRNPDGQRSREDARVAIVPPGSLAAPLAVRAAAVVHPAPGSFYGQDESVRPRGTLLTSGTGPLTVTWLFDGVPFDRIVVHARGGQPVPVEARMRLPAAALGPHRIQLAVEGTQRLVSEAVTVVQVMSRASRLRALWPADGAVAVRDDVPRFRWSPVAGATGYEIAFRNGGGRLALTVEAERPDRRFGSRELARLEPGTYEWRVRARFAGGTWGEPSDARRLTLLPHEVDLRLEAPRRDPSSNRIETRWTGGAHGLLYRLEFLGPDGNTIFSALTLAQSYRLPRGRMLPSTRLRVTAFGPRARAIGSSSVLDVGPSWSDLESPNAGRVLARTWLPAGSPDSAGGPMVVEQIPRPGEQVDTVNPPIGARWTPGVEPGAVTLTIDTTDVTAVADVSADRVTYTPLLPLEPGEQTVDLTLGDSHVSWAFTVPGGVRQDDAPADAEPELGGDAETEEPPGLGPPATWQLASEATVSHVSGDVMPTGFSSYAMLSVNADSGEPASRGGFARGSGDLSLRDDDAAEGGEQQDNRNWIAEVGAIQGGRYRQRLGVGYVPPGFLSGAELLTPGLTTGGVEAAFEGARGKLSYYHTFDDDLAGVSAGTFGPAQRLRAAAAELGGEERSYVVRLVGLRVEEDDGEFFFGGRGDLLGIIGRWAPADHSQITFEAARGSMTPSPGSLEEPRRGNAARIVWNGSYGELGIEAGLRHTQAHFVNPANRGLTASGVPNTTGADLAVTRTWEASSFRAAYQWTATSGGTSGGDGSLDTFDLQWSGAVHQRVVLTLGGSTTATHSRANEELALPRVDQRDWSAQLALQESFGSLTLVQDLTFQRSDDDTDPARFIEMAQAGFSATYARSEWFHLSSQLTWVRTRAGASRDGRDSLLAVFQPGLRFPKGFDVQPYVAYSLERDDLTPDDARIESYRVTLSWLPPWARSHLALQGSTDWGRQRGPAVERSPVIARYTASLTLRWGHPDAIGDAPVTPLIAPPVTAPPYSASLLTPGPGRSPLLARATGGV